MSVGVDKRISALDGFRFFAIMTIVLSHVSILSFVPRNSSLIKFFNNPTLGVDYFFMLSGFGVYRSQVKKSAFINEITGVARICNR